MAESRESDFSYNSVSFDDHTSNTETKVDIVGISRNALKGLYQALEKQAGLISDLTKGIADVSTKVDGNTDATQTVGDNNSKAVAKAEEEARKNAFSERNRDIANTRRSRAASAAVNDKVDKALTTMETLGKIMSDFRDKAVNMLKTNFKKALNKYDDLSSNLRRANVSHQDKLNAHELSSRANTVEGGFRVDKGNINAALFDFANTNNAMFQKLVRSKDEASTRRANYMGMMRQIGFDSDTIAKLMTTTSDDRLGDLETLILRASDPASSSATIKLIQDTLTNNYESISSDVVGNLTKMTDEVRKFSTIGTNFTDNDKVAIAELGQNIASGNIQNVKDANALASVLGISGNIKDPTAIFEGISSRLKYIQDLSKTDKEAAQREAERLQSALKPLKELNPTAINSMMQATTQAATGMLNIDENVKTDTQLREDNKDNTTEGKLQNAVGWALDKANAFTADLGLDGGLLGKLSVNLDEIFGGDVQTGDTVADGFTNVISVLKSIRLSMIAQSAFKFFKEGPGAGILSSLGSFFGLKQAATAAAGTGAGAASGAGAGAVGKKVTESKSGKYQASKKSVKSNYGKAPKATPTPKPAPTPAAKGKYGWVGLAGSAIIGGGIGYAFSKLFGSDSESSADQQEVNEEIAYSGDDLLSVNEETARILQDSGDDLLSVVIEIRDAVCKRNEELNEILSRPIEVSELPQSVSAASLVLGAVSKNPLDKAAENIGKKVGDAIRSPTTELTSKVNTAMAKSSAETTGAMSKLGNKFSSTATKFDTSMSKVASKLTSVESKIGATAVGKTAGVVAKTGVKTASKAAGPLSLLLDVGIGAYDMHGHDKAQKQHEANSEDLNSLKLRKELELKAAKANGDTDLINSLTSELQNINDSIDAELLAAENERQEFWASGSSAMASLTAGAAGLAIGAAVGGPVGAVVGGAIGAIGGYFASEAAREKALEWQRMSHDEQIEFIRKKREEMQAEVDERKTALIEQGFDDVSAELAASMAQDKGTSEKLAKVFQGAQKSGLSEASLSRIAIAGNGDVQRTKDITEKIGNLNVRAGLTQEEMNIIASYTTKDTKQADLENMAAQMLSTPERVYSNVAFILTNVEAMRTNLMNIYQRVNRLANGLGKKFSFANGGVITNATNAIIGEDGKEVVLPLTKPRRISELLSELTDKEKLLLIKALIKDDNLVNALTSFFIPSSDNTSTDSAADKKQVEDVTLAEGSAIAENMIIGASKQTGKKYAEMVCNQLVEAAMKWAGFTPPTTGPVFKHFNHPKMHLILNDPEKGISPNDSKLKPGMIMFSHPFTQAEADELNRTKGNGRKAGDPGHMGIYAGNGLWWNSTSSKKTTDYSSGKGVKVTDNNKGFGVALTKPFTTGTYKLYAAGYYDGMFDAASVKGLPETSPKELKEATNVSPAYSSIKNAGLFTDEELSNIAMQAGIDNSYTMAEFMKQAGKAIADNSGNRDDIISILIEIAKYLKGAIQSKSPMMSTARPPVKVYS